MVTLPGQLRRYSFCLRSGLAPPCALLLSHPRPQQAGWTKFVLFQKQTGILGAMGSSPELSEDLCG